MNTQDEADTVIIINYSHVMEQMKKLVNLDEGFNPFPDGWSNSLLDTLEEMYGLETKLKEIVSNQ